MQNEPIVTLYLGNKVGSSQLLNSALQNLEQALEARKQTFAEAALRPSLDAEWLDLTLPAPGPRRGHLHPITRIQRELEELFSSGPADLPAHDVLARH